MGKFYSKRSKLYEEGLELLLDQWDKSRAIERDEIYRDLSVDRKLELLSYLAVKKFEQEQYVLFEQGEIEGYIGEFLGIGLRDSRAVLRAMEAQHGLLIERSQRVWSFSHLTFQEYLVAKWSCFKADWQELFIYTTKPRWREVFLLIVDMLKDTKFFLQLMKGEIDAILACDINLQQYLVWLSQKAQSLNFSYSQAAIRSLCMTLTVDDPDNLDLPYCLGIELDFNFLPDRPSNDERLISEFAVDRNLRLALFYVSGQRGIFYTSSTESTYTKSLKVTVYNSIKQILKHEIKYIKPRDYYLENSLKLLINQLPRWWLKIKTLDNKMLIKIEQWWNKYGEAWTHDLRKIMIHYRNIGHDWQFSEEQQQLLQQYYDAHQLLVDCLNSGNVSLKVKEELLETLLLPIAEIEKRKREKLEEGIYTG